MSGGVIAMGRGSSGAGGAGGKSNAFDVDQIKLEGSPKQISWAQDILKNSAETLERNIALSEKNAKQYPDMAKDYRTDKALFEALRDGWIKQIKKMTTASEVISARTRIDAKAILSAFDKVKMRAQMVGLKQTLKEMNGK